MAVKIRLKRFGKRNAACYRVVVADERSARDGKFIEEVGFYNPKSKEETVKLDRIDYWLSVGAQASETVERIVKRVKEGTKLVKAAPKGLNKPAAKKVEATEEAV